MINTSKLIAGAIEARKKSGRYYRENRPVKCRCGAVVDSVPAVCWGTVVGDGWLKDGMEIHECPTTAKRIEAGISTEVKEIADYVVLVQGHPCFITDKEREQYLGAIANSMKIIEIRDYAFDRMYPVLPYGEWREEQERRNKRTAAYMTIGD